MYAMFNLVGLLRPRLAMIRRDMTRHALSRRVSLARVYMARVYMARVSLAPVSRMALALALVLTPAVPPALAQGLPQPSTSPAPLGLPGTPGPAGTAPAEAAPAFIEGERVKLPGEEVNLNGMLFRPAGPGPFPAVVALHGCGGLWDRVGGLSARHADWGNRLAQAGLIVLMPDSFGSRGLGSQCGTKESRVRASRERVADALAARRWLQARADVKPRRVSLLGWANGGATVLAAIRTDRSPADGQPDFAKAVAFYPGCRVQAESPTFEARVPALLLIGEADDWTPVAPCDRLVKAARGRGENFEIVIYPGALHDFDHPSRAPVRREGLAFTPDGSGTANVGTDPAARDDALKRVPEFLAR
jgi:dienelactone hydrolase